MAGIYSSCVKAVNRFHFPRELYQTWYSIEILVRLVIVTDHNLRANVTISWTVISMDKDDKDLYLDL